MILVLPGRILEALVSLTRVGKQDLVAFNSDERGQTATEYVAILVVAVAIVLGVLWSVLSGALEGVIETLGTELTAFTNSVF